MKQALAADVLAASPRGWSDCCQQEAADKEFGQLSTAVTQPAGGLACRSSLLLLYDHDTCAAQQADVAACTGCSW